MSTNFSTCHCAHLTPYPELSDNLHEIAQQISFVTLAIESITYYSGDSAPDGVCFVLNSIEKQLNDLRSRI